MATYLIQGSYTAESWAALTQNPQDRSKTIQSMVELKGKGQGLMSEGIRLGDHPTSDEPALRVAGMQVVEGRMRFKARVRAQVLIEEANGLRVVVERL